MARPPLHGGHRRHLGRRLPHHEEARPRRTFIRRDQTFGRAQRIVTANQRNYAQTLKQLLAIEANRASAAPSLPDDAADNEPLTPQLVSLFTETPESDPHQPP